VAKEIRQGLVTVEGAKRYGVVIAADGSVDEAATTALRAKMRAERPAELPLFDYGPGIETLRRTSKAETGLPAPRQPVWHATALAAE
jgi:N-methylhydantoinase B